MKRAVRMRLEETLRSESRRALPAFSPALHQRVMGALRTQGLPHEAPRTTTRPRSLWRIGIPLALAAGLALAAWIILRPAPPAAPKDTLVIAPTPPSIKLPDLQPAASPDDILASRKYAYLDRDAKKLWTFVADQLPDLPEPRK
jgi:hypothetical protein